MDLADGGDDDDDAAGGKGEKKKKNTYKHLIKDIPGVFPVPFVSDLYNPSNTFFLSLTGKHSLAGP